MARIDGTNNNDIINGLAGDDWISGNRGDDRIDGGGGNDRIVDYLGNNEIYGGEGKDQIVGGRDKDIIDGGSGDDIVWTGAGDDIGIYTLSENRNAKDYYDGGYGTDTFRLRLTQAELNSAAIQADIEAYQNFLQANANSNKADGPVFKFTSFDLQLRNWEKLEVEVITPPALSIADAQVVEGGTLVFTVSVDKADPNASITATYTITFPNGASPADLPPGTPLTATVTIPAGQNQANPQLQIPTLDDLLAEGTETFTVTLSNLSANAQAGDLQAIGTILDNEAVPTVSIADAQVTEGGVLTFVVTSTVADQNQDITATYTITFPNGVSPADLSPGTPLTGTVTIPAGQTQASPQLQIPTLDDLLAEGTETFTVTLSNLSANAQVGDLQAIGTILDNEAVPTVSIADAQVTEGGVLTFLVASTIADQNQDITATYTITFPNGATAADLPPGTPLTGTVTIPAGQTQANPQLQIPTLDDLLAEGTETFTVTLSNLSANAQAGDLQAIGTILDNDPTLEGETIWQNGGHVIIGSLTTPTVFNVGTNAPGPTTADRWTNVDGDRLWGTSGNWLDGSAPSATDNVIFNAVDSGGTNLVNRAFIINELHYTASGGHITDLSGVNELKVTGDASVGVANAGNRGALTIISVNVTALLEQFSVGFNDAGSGLTSGYLNLTQNTILTVTTPELSIGRVANAGFSARADGHLTLADGSVLHLGTVDQRAVLNIGWNQSSGQNPGPPFENSSAATGDLNVLNAAAALDWHLSELNVGRGAGRGTTTGTLHWDQTEALDVNAVTFGRGSATGILDVPVDGTLLLGSAAAPVSTLRIAYNDAGNGLGSANLDFSGTTFEAYVATELSIGRVANAGFSARADGHLTLADRSALHLGTVDQRAVLNIGWNQSSGQNPGPPFENSSAATGEFDAFDGTLTAHLSELNTGRTAGRGTASGGLILGDDSDITATTVNIGVGNGASGNIQVNGGNFHATTVNQQVGSFDFSGQTLNIGNTGALAVQSFNLKDGVLTGDTINLGGGAFNFTGGTLAVDTFNGSLNQLGGSLAPGGSPGTTAINGNYSLASAGALDIELSGLSPGAGYDQLEVNGLVNLNSNNGAGGLLDVLLGFAPGLGQSFTFIENDGADAIAGRFAGLSEGASFNEVFAGFQYTFDISYLDGDGNDVGVTVIGVAPV